MAVRTSAGTVMSVSATLPLVNALAGYIGGGVGTVPVATGGAGYVAAPTVAFTGGGGTGAAATAFISGGVVTGIVITNPGTGYTTAPTATLTGGTPTTAATVGAVVLTTAVPWTPIGELTDPGEFGRKYAEIKHTPVASRGAKKFKGSYDEGTMSLKLGLDNKDLGQAVLRQARNSDNDYSFRIALPSGDFYYFMAKVMEFTVGGMTVDAVTAATVALSITTANDGSGVVENLAP